MIDLLERAREDRIAQEEYAFDKGRLEGELKGVVFGKVNFHTNSNPEVMNCLRNFRQMALKI